MKLTPMTMSTLSAALTILCLTSCKTPDKVSEASGASNGSKSGSSSSTVTDGTTGGAGTTGSAATGDKTKAASAEQGLFSSALDDIPQLKPLQKLNISKLPPAMVICTVDGTPITVSGFQREFANDVAQFQMMLGQQPDKVAELCSQAAAMHVALTDEEKKRILTTAHSPQALEGKKFEDFIKEKKVSAKDFETQVLNLGLAFKVGTKIIEGNQLSKMVNRIIVLKEATQKGYYQKALNSYIKIKDTPQFKQLVAQAPDSPTEIKDQVIEAEEMKMVVEALAKNVTVSDQALKAEYEKDKNRFTHGERLRLSHIVIAMPDLDSGPLKSVRTQLKEQFPNMTAAELDKEEKNFKEGQLKKAQELLEKAKKGEDFKTLADNYTDDMPARQAKNGGDLGFVDSGKQIGPDQLKIVSAVKDLKVGEVAPQLVQTNFGYHIVKLTEKQPAGTRTYEEVKLPLKQYLTQMEIKKAQDLWLEQKRHSAQIALSPECSKELASADKPAAAASEPAVPTPGSKANTVTQ
jgi:parvulin-like peptidyl-prolyl isomerase